ncbi:MAG: glycosyltransferase family 4 protein [Gemmatimonadota bacterium]
MRINAGRSLRILYWTEGFPPYTGGTEVLGSTLLAGLRKRGHSFTVVTAHGHLDLPDQDEHDGIPVHRLPFHSAVTDRDPARILEILQRVDRIKRALRPDVVHVGAVGASLIFHLQSTRSNPIPWIFTPHAPLTDQATGPGTILGEAFHTAHEIVCVSNAQRESIRRIAPEAGPRSSVIYNALEPPSVEPAPLPFEPPRLACLGRHVRDKGFDVALSGFARLTERFPALRLTLIGDGPERPALERQASELGLAERVAFAGRVPEVPPLLNAATVIVMPSRWEETFGLVALEGALMGRPVVASRVGALPEVVVDGETGLIVEKEDSAGLADAIACLLERPETARRMGRAARERALETFSLSRCIDRYDELYQRMAGAVMADSARGTD